MQLKQKKIWASLLSILLAISILLGLPSMIQTGKRGSDPVTQALSSLSLEVTPMTASAAGGEFRRPVSNESPMWIVHIDSWNYADPAKIIQLIPEDIRPFAVFNISLSINWDSTNHKWLMVQDGYECAKSWLRTCADAGVWAMIQPSSGGQCHFPDYSADYDLDNTVFGEFFRDYPNFIGYNYCEQFWGFESADFPITCPDRYRHFAALLKLCDKYGGYLDVSWCANQWSAGINPIAMLKTVPEWESACRTYSDHFILEEKYTQVSYIEDVESMVYGAYIAGYCGNFGVRYDDTGWTDSTWSGSGDATKDQYRVSTSLPIHIERMAMNGATVIDGPELVWADDFYETWGGTKDSEGYTARTWGMYDQFQNAVLDLYRKVQDGTIRIPTRAEVIQRTKVVVIQDVNSGNNDDKYSTYPTLFEGLYRMSGDGNLKDNHDPFKSTGRYQTIPTVTALLDDLAKSIPVQIKQSEIASRWPTIEAKQEEFNNLYASDYWGNCFAGRNASTWLTYNPFKDGTAAGGYLSLRYNTCDQVEVTYSAYGTGVIREYADHLDVYLNNYDEEEKTTRKTSTIKVYGATAKPTFTYQDRGVNQTASQISDSFEDGVYILTVQHNGPVDIAIQCAGDATDRLTAPQPVALTAPAAAPFYTGIRQYEGEFFDTKNIEGNVTNACNSGVTGCWGQGFLKFGAGASAAAKDTVTTQLAGDFTMTLRYSATSSINNLDLYVNGTKVKTLSLAGGSSYSDWKTITETVTLKAGDNTIGFQAGGTLASSLYIDCFTVEGNFGTGTTPDDPVVIEPIQGTLIRDLMVYDTDNASNWSIAYDFKVGGMLYGDRDITCAAAPNGLESAEYIRTACESKLYPDTLATFVAAKDVVVYVAVDNRVDTLLDWLDTWEKTTYTVTSSNDVVFNLYTKTASAGETVTLGTNGGYGLSANYLAFVLEQALTIVGDVNVDGQFAISDVVMLQKWLLGAGALTDWEAGDVVADRQINGFDLAKMRQMLLQSPA